MSFDLLHFLHSSVVLALFVFAFVGFKRFRKLISTGITTTVLVITSMVKALARFVLRHEPVHVYDTVFKSTELMFCDLERRRNHTDVPFTSDVGFYFDIIDKTVVDGVIRSVDSAVLPVDYTAFNITGINHVIALSADKRSMIHYERKVDRYGTRWVLKFCRCDKDFSLIDAYMLLSNRLSLSYLSAPSVRPIKRASVPALLDRTKKK